MPVTPKSKTENKNKDLVLKVSIQNKFDEFDSVDPVPISNNGNSFRYAKNQKYIPFLGNNDNYPNVLLAARLSSTTQNACIGSIAESLVGKGITVKDVEKPNQDLLNWMKNVNNRRQTFDESLIGTVDGERAFGNQFVEIVRGEVGKQRFLKIYNHSMLFCRLAVPDNEMDDPDSVVLSKAIARSGYVDLPKDTVKIPLWNDNILEQKRVWVRGSDGFEHTMLHFKNEVSGVEHYGLPKSISSLRHQILEAKAAQYNIDNFDNNMILGGMLILKSGMTQEEALTTAEEIMMSHVGDGKTGRMAVISSESGMADVEFIPYNTQREGSFIEFDKRVEEKIICSNQWDSVLAGINRSSTFGNGSQYIRSIWDVKDAVLLYPLRTKLINKVVKPIINIWADWFGVEEVKSYEFNLQTSMPFSYMADLDPNTFFKLNEARGKAGLKPDKTNGEKYLSEMGGKQAVGTPTQTPEVNIDKVA